MAMFSFFILGAPKNKENDKNDSDSGEEQFLSAN